MKILKILLISIVILISLLLTAGIIFIKTFDLNRFKPQIISQANKALNRRVNFEKMSLSFSLRRGINLKISNLLISDESAFEKNDFLAVKDIFVAIDVLKYIFKKEVNVTNVLIDSPSMTIIRQKDGIVNVQTSVQSVQAGKESATFPRLKPPLAIPAILISSLNVSNGAVTFIDHSFEPPLRLGISDVRFSMSKISLTESFPFIAEAAILNDKRNIKLEGKASIDLKTNEITISEVKGTLELSDIRMEKIPVAFPMTKGAVFPESLKGKAQILIKNLTAGPNGLIGLTADIVLNDGVLRFKEMALPIENVAMNVNITEKKIIFDKASLVIGKGKITASGAIDNYLAAQEYNIDADAQNLKLQDLLAQDKSPVKVEGLASAKMKLKGQGFTPQALQSTLSGEADISIVQAMLKDLNVFRTVLDKISVIPGLAQRIEAGLPQAFKQKLTQPDTVLSDIKLPVTLENGRLLTKDAALGAEEFMFKGNIETGFDGSYFLEGSFLIPQEISASMVARLPELQYLLNESKQIYIPLKISGKAGNPKFKVDAEYIAKRVFTNQATEQLFKAIDKALGTKENTNPAEQNTPETQQNTPQADLEKKSATQERVRKIIDSIFKK